MSRRVTAVLAALLIASGLGPEAAADEPPSGGVTPLGLMRVRADELRGTGPAGLFAGQVSPAATSNGSTFMPLSPVRVLDTRAGAGNPVGPAGTVSVDLSSVVPASTTAVVLNVTGVAPSQPTFVTVWPSGAERPTASNLNLAAGQIRSNAVTVAVSALRRISLYNNRGSVHLAADLAGYYAAAAGSMFTPKTRTRVLDTRPQGPVGPGGTVTIDLSSRVPASATAVTFTLTGLGATASTFITAWPAGTARPLASSLNLAPGAITPNQVTVRLGADRKVSLYNHSGNVQLIADLAGFYATDQGNPFYQLAPLRSLDTRDRESLGPDSFQIMDMDGHLPATATALVFNLTGTNPTASTFESAIPYGVDLSVTTSNLNLVAGQTAAVLVTVELGQAPGRPAAIYNKSGSVDLIVDLAGYFAPPPPPCTGECVHSWGDNTSGQLGVGTTGGSANTAGRISGLSGARAATAGVLNSYALTTTGAVWAWGFNSLAGLGNGLSYGMSTVPSRVRDLPPIASIAAAAYTTYALGSGGVRAWGYNADGGLGDGTTEPHSLPVQVDGLESGVVQVAGGYTTGYALKADGTVWAWGANGGSLGNGEFGTGCDSVPSGAGCRATRPIQVSGLSGVISIAATWNNAFAIKSDGTVWAWGWNAEGELGIGTAGGSACYQELPPTAPNCVAVSPVQVPALSGVVKIIGGGSATAYAIKPDRTVLAWGTNRSGQLGNGTAGGEACAGNPIAGNCFSSVPVAVSALTDVKDVAGGRFFALAVRQDDTVWSWGDDTYGQLGAPDPSSVPVQVASLSGVSAVGAGGFSSLSVMR